MTTLENTVNTVFSWEQYFDDCIQGRKPYWGHQYIRTLASPTERLPILAGLVERLQGAHDFRILEIGSYAGASAVTLAASLQRWHDGKGRVYCVDPWSYPIHMQGIPEGKYRDDKGRDMAAYSFEDMFHYNIRAAGVADLVVSVKAGSREILPVLQKEAFDLVYIDGDHSHQGAYFDITTGMNLVREGGYLCGDDLEKQLPDDTASLENCHLGVTQAVYDAFKRKISCTDGLWAVQKRNGWQDVDALTSVSPDWVTPLYSVMPNLVGRLASRMTENNWTRAVLYGAGKHTKRLLRYVLDESSQLFEIQGIVDDQVENGAVADVPIITHDAVSRCKPDVIITSSDTCELTLAERAKECFPDIPCIQLYK